MASSDSRKPGRRAHAKRRSAFPLSGVIDHGIMDREGKRGGRVDELLIELREGADRRPELVLREVVSGPLPRPASRALAAIARFFYRLLGVRDPQAAAIAWSRVRMLDVAVHLDVERQEAGLRKVDAACERIVRHIPAAEKAP
jgi:hypothetical protein